MNLHQHHGWTPVINAAGTFTPLGVSRSSPAVAHAVAQALGEFFVIDELQASASRAIAAYTGAEAGAVTHCAAAGITLAVAAAIAGDDPAAVAALPDCNGHANRIVLPAGHAVDYGHPITTDVRLAGGHPVLAGTTDARSLDELEHALAEPDVAALLLVSSRLVQGSAPALADAVAAAHRRGVPAFIDGAAQDLRVDELLATGADLVLVSAHKYLASPTAGLIVGRARWVAGCRAHERGIGRAMKASKEAIVGVLAALDQRQVMDHEAWRSEQKCKVRWLIDQIEAIDGLRASEIPDPAGMPFSRVALEPTAEAAVGGRTAAALARALRDGTPSIWVMEHEAARGRLLLELVPLRQDELQIISDRLADLKRQPMPSTLTATH